MATLETQQVDAIIDNSRRKMLTLGGAALAGVALAGVASKASAATTLTDNDILNFALNLEYLEANFYNLAVYGVTIDKLTAAQGGPISLTGTGTGTAGTVTTKPNFAAVSFGANTLVQDYATETALEEAKHVTFLQGALGSNAVAMPNLELYTSFNTLAGAAMIGASFDPFASAENFLIGAYIFEDVGVSAYHGAAGFISDKKNILPAAVGIHAVEAYHAGLIRTTIAGMDAKNNSNALSMLTQKVSALRTTLTNSVAGSTPAYDVGLGTTTVALNGSAGQYTSATIVDADPTTAFSIAPGRTTAQVLAIVTAGNSGGGSGFSSGLFYPNGLNGTIK